MSINDFFGDCNTAKRKCPPLLALVLPGDQHLQHSMHQNTAMQGMHAAVQHNIAVAIGHYRIDHTSAPPLPKSSRLQGLVLCCIAISWCRGLCCALAACLQVAGLPQDAGLRADVAVGSATRAFSSGLGAAPFAMNHCTLGGRGEPQQASVRGSQWPEAGGRVWRVCGQVSQHRMPIVSCRQEDGCTLLRALPGG